MDTGDYINLDAEISSWDTLKDLIHLGYGKMGYVDINFDDIFGVH